MEYKSLNEKSKVIEVQAPPPIAVIGAPIRAERELGCCAKAGRGILMLINFLFLVAGVAGVVASTMIISGKFSRYFDYCHFCNGLSITGVSVFSTLLVISLLGFVSAWRRQNCLLSLYNVFLGLLVVIGIAIGVVVILIHLGYFDGDLHDAWNLAVKNDPAAMCALEMESGCSGWKIWCPANASQAANPSLCPLDCTGYGPDTANAVQYASKTCNQELHHEVQKYFIAITASSFGMAVLSLVGIATSCSIRRKYDEYVEIAERF